MYGKFPVKFIRLCLQKENPRARKFYLPEINQPKSIFSYGYLPPEKCNVGGDLSVLPLLRYKWLRGQRETVGKSICIHLSLFRANYFSAGLKALSICSVCSVCWSQFRQERWRNDQWPTQTKVEWQRRKLMETDDKKSQKNKSLGYDVKKRRSQISWTIFVSMTTQGALCLACKHKWRVKSGIFGIPAGQVVIGSACLGVGGGRGRVDMRIWFAYWAMKDGQGVGGDGWQWWMKR